MTGNAQRGAIAAAPYLFTIVFFVLWEAACRLFRIPVFFLPAPSVIAQAGIEYWSQLLFHSFHTLWMTVAGFAIAVVFGILLGIALGASRVVNAGSQPLLVGFNAIPKVAVVPILILWFGVGWVPPVMTAFLISFFPIVVNVATGLSTIEPELEDVMKALGAKKWDILVKIGIPRSMPYLFASLKVAITLPFVGSVRKRTRATGGEGTPVAISARGRFPLRHPREARRTRAGFPSVGGRQRRNPTAGRAAVAWLR